MNASSPPPASRRRRMIVITAIVAAVVLIVIAIVASQSVRSDRAIPATSTAAPSSAASASAAPTTTRAPSTSSSPSAATPSAQPTRTASLDAPTAAPITGRLAVKVTKTEAVSGIAEGPGDIAGPAVRFTVTITNGTGKRVDLTDTVVNAYFGTDLSPANPLQKPGGRPFPTSVANGATAEGVFIFTIPKDQRSQVELTVDTSVRNPVIAFRGSVPR